MAQDCSPVEKHLQAVAGQLACRSAVNLKGVRVTQAPGRPLELELSLWLCGPGQCHASSESDCRAHKHEPLQNTIKLIVSAGSSFKTFGTAAEEVNQFRRNASRAATFHLWKGRTCFAFQCSGLFYSDWLSTFRIFLPIHLSIGCSNL